jgi:hypothetical protein
LLSGKNFFSAIHLARRNPNWTFTELGNIHIETFRIQVLKLLKSVAAAYYAIRASAMPYALGYGYGLEHSLYIPRAKLQYEEFLPLYIIIIH